jgi:4'-phosphopantetheinyl transferase
VIGASLPPRWSAPPADLRASRDRVDVWCLPIDRDATARAALRALLGRYLGLPAARIELGVTSRGKPVLMPGAHPDLRFNLSHSGALALVAVRLGEDVGVDLEAIRDDVDCDAVVATTFPAAQRLVWRTVLAARRREAFFDAWVRMEAIAKASGRGIALGDAEHVAAGYACRALPLLPGFAAAVASRGNAWELACWRMATATSAMEAVGVAG